MATQGKERSNGGGAVVDEESNKTTQPHMLWAGAPLNVVRFVPGCRIVLTLWCTCDGNAECGGTGC